jgi:flagellar motor switch protein FliN
MADDKILGQDDIEKLFSQTAGGANPAAAPQASGGGDAMNASTPDASQSKPAAPISDVDQDKLLAQEEIEKLLNPTGGAPQSKIKENASRSSAGEDSMAEKDIEFLLNQAEKALESIGSTANRDLPQGVSEFRLQELSGAPASTDTATMDLVRDVELNLKIELGRTHMYLEDVLKLRKGSVVPLDKLAGDPVDVYVNGRLVARGEVLVLNDNFCVRVAELITGANVFD